MPANAPLLLPLSRILDVICAFMAIEKSVLLYALDYFCKRAYASTLSGSTSGPKREVRSLNEAFEGFAFPAWRWSLYLVTN